MRATTLALRAAAGVQPSWPSYCGTRPSRTHLRSVAELVPIRSATSRCVSLSLFAASMMTLVLADNLLLLVVSWELVGFCSFLLIGFYYERRSAVEAAKKAFITTRAGDVGLITSG